MDKVDRSFIPGITSDEPDGRSTIWEPLDRRAKECLLQNLEDWELLELLEQMKAGAFEEVAKAQTIAATEAEIVRRNSSRER